MAWRHPDIVWKLWAWQRAQQLLGALIVTAAAGVFLVCLAVERLPADFGLDIAIAKSNQPWVDHNNIAQAIGSCHLPGTVDSWPADWRKSVRISNTTDTDGRAYGLTALEHAALWQSERIRNERAQFADDADKRQKRARRNQLRVLCLSAAGAFMVGMRTLALNKDSEAPFRSLMKGALLPISVFALLLPLLATAISGIATFDQDPSLVISDVRALAQLEQLHGRIAEDVTSDPFLCPITRATKALYGVSETPSPDPNFPASHKHFNLCLTDRLNRTAAWEQRHEQILNDATQTLAHAGDLPRPGDQPMSPPEKHSKDQSAADACQVAFHSLASPDPTQSPYQDVSAKPR